MLRAMRLADSQRFPVLGVNLGKLGFLAEVDVPDLTMRYRRSIITSSPPNRGWRSTP